MTPGRGVEQDETEGVRWLEMAAEQGRDDARQILGIIEDSRAELDDYWGPE